MDALLIMKSTLLNSEQPSAFNWSIYLNLVDNTMLLGIDALKWLNCYIFWVSFKLFFCCLKKWKFWIFLGSWPTFKFLKIQCFAFIQVLLTVYRIAICRHGKQTNALRKIKIHKCTARVACSVMRNKVTTNIKASWLF